MASAMRPCLLRQACMSAPTKGLGRTPGFSTFRPSFSSTLRSSARTPAAHKVRPAFVKEGILPRAAAFHTSSKRDILPPPPQRLRGTANEAAPVPTPHSTEGAYHWLMERGVSVLILPITAAPFIGGSLNPILDSAFCALLVIHSHMGFKSCIIDYFPRDRVPKLRTAADWLLLVSSVAVAWGLWEFETNDVGVTEAVKRIWKA